MFTYQYAQPDEYHFSLDSIQFAELIASEYASYPDLSTLRVLDLCAGCGVIGLQLSWFLREIKQIDFIEVQEIYQGFFDKNIAIVNRKELTTQWHGLNYNDLLMPQWANQYDLIVSNPPYFHTHHGMLSPSTFKNRCRFYLDSTFENFILAIANALSPKGKAYFLTRSLKEHGLDILEKTRQLIPDNFLIEKITSIRGTDVILIIKLS